MITDNLCPDCGNEKAYVSPPDGRAGHDRCWMCLKKFNTSFDTLREELFATIHYKRAVLTWLEWENAVTDAMVVLVARRSAEAKALLRGTEYALGQAESVIEQALAYGDARAFDALRSYGLTSPAEGEQK